MGSGMYRRRLKYRELLWNSQSAAVEWGIHNSLVLLFIAAKALETIGSSVVEEEIFFAKAVSMA